jgi:hypothetical protein
MTQRYLVGELSLLLEELQVTTADQGPARELARLRREAETWPMAALSSVAARALVVSEELCWDSLTRADVAAFARQAALCAELHEFGICAGLLEDE